MATIDDKLKLFAKIVFENIEKDSEQKVIEFTKNYDNYIESEKQNISKQSEFLVKQTKKRAEAKKNQIVSKASIDRQHSLLKTRKELFDQTVEDIKKLALNFTSEAGYVDFLEKSIKSSISNIDAKDIIVFFKQRDIDNHGDKIGEFVKKFKLPDVEVSIMATDKDIIGGCYVEDKDTTIRVDCSMVSMIDDNRKLIGKMLMDNLQ